MSFQSIAAVPGNSQPQLVDPIEPSKVSAGEVICETVFLGVCGTDREILHAGTPHVPPGEEQLVLGHECLARVLEVGCASGVGSEIVRSAALMSLGAFALILSLLPPQLT